MTDQEQIDDIMDNFPFARIQAMMEADGWTWGSRPHLPDESELRQTARRLLRSLADEELSHAGTGGYTAIKTDGVLALYWGVDYAPDIEEGDEWVTERY